MLANKINFFILAIGLLFSFFAGLAAFFITYEEYNHHFSDKKKSFKISLETAGIAFSFFCLISLIMGFVF